MIDDTDTDGRDPWSGPPDPRVIAALGAEFERIVGASALTGPASGVNWALPVKSPAELLKFLQEIPSDIGMEGFEARLRVRSREAPALDRTPLGRHAEDSG